MPGSIRSMQLEHVLRNVQTDRGSLLHGRLLRWQFDTVTLAHRMPSGGVHPITQLGRSALSRRRPALGSIASFRAQCELSLDPGEWRAEQTRRNPAPAFLPMSRT